MTTVLSAVEIIGGLLLFLYAFSARGRREPAWVRVGWSLAGVFTEFHVMLTHYLRGLWLSHNSRYWIILLRRDLMDGVIIGVLLMLLFRYVGERAWKVRVA